MFGRSRRSSRHDIDKYRAQAHEAAEAAKSYLDVMSFSRDGLFDQLTSSHGAGFTADQANAGLAAVGY